MDDVYYTTVDKMTKMGVAQEYAMGWMSGYLRNPKIEEQRITEGYTAGYEDGMNKNTDRMQEWVKK